MISSLWLSRSSLRVTLSNLLGLLASLLSGSSRLSAKQHLCPTLTYQRSVESQQYALNERRVWSWSGPAYTVARGVPYRPRRLVSSPPGRSVSRPTAAVTIIDPVNGIHNDRRSLSHLGR